MALTTPAGPPDDDEEVVEVPRSSLRELRGLVVAVVVVTLLGLGWGVWFSWQQDKTNDHLSRSDAQAAQDREALERLVRREAQEEEVEAAVRCVRSHLNYATVLELAEAVGYVGARVGTDAHLSLLGATEAEAHAAHAQIDRLLPEQMQPLKERYPRPGCDRQAAERELQEAPPDMVDDARDGQ